MNSQWLKRQFQINPDKSKAALARSLNLEPSAISKILSGTRQIKANEYIRMQKFFGLTSADNQNEKSKKAYVIKPLQNLSEREAAHGEWSIPATILEEKTSAPPEKIKIFLIEEDIMEPDLNQGEHVIVDISDITPDPEGIFIMSDDFSYMARHCTLKTKSSPPQIIISATDPNFETQTLKYSDVKLIGRVIGKMPWL